MSVLFIACKLLSCISLRNKLWLLSPANGVWNWILFWRCPSFCPYTFRFCTFSQQLPTKLCGNFQFHFFSCSWQWPSIKTVKLIAISKTKNHTPHQTKLFGPMEFSLYKYYSKTSQDTFLIRTSYKCQLWQFYELMKIDL